MEWNQWLVTALVWFLVGGAAAGLVAGIRSACSQSGMTESFATASKLKPLRDRIRDYRLFFFHREKGGFSMKSLMTFIGMATGLLAAVLPTPASAFVPTYDSEQAARLACGADKVVYIDFNSWRYYYEGNREFGHAIDGRYACAKEAAIDYMDGQVYPTSADLFSSRLNAKTSFPKMSISGPKKAGLGVVG